jgi:hypothetical protein
MRAEKDIENEKHTPLLTRLFTIESSPTNAPLRIKSTFEVSIWKVSGLSG